MNSAKPTTKPHSPPNDRQHWAETQEAGSGLGIGLMVACYRYGGRWLFLVLLLPVMLFFYASRKPARAAANSYLQKMHAAHGGISAPRPWHSFRLFWQFGLALLDKFSVWLGDIGRDDVVLHQPEIIDDMLDQGQGGVIFISHIGNFEICQALSETRPGFRLTVLHHTKHADKFNKVLNKYNQDSPVELLQVTDVDVGVAMMLSEKIAAGQFVAIAADRVPVNNPNPGSTTDLLFLGELARFPTGPFVLAKSLKAPVLLINCIKQRGRYNIYFEYLSDGSSVPRSQRKAQLAELMQRYVARLEHFCQLAPWQWFNFYPFWLTDQPSSPRPSQANVSTAEQPKP